MFDWIIGHLWTSIELAFAGAWAGLLHKGTGVALIVLLLFLAYGTRLLAMIPMVGPLLSKFFEPLRKDLLWAAFGVGVFLAGQFVGTHDEAARCVAKTVVIENVVDKTVKSTTPKPTKDRKPVQDRWDNPEN